ncbi:MAG: hypothetical protein Q7S57_06160 [bacterium]|nr:hypothetical protein [bacterium]
MAKILLITNPRPTAQEQEVALQLLWQYRKRENDASLQPGGFFSTLVSLFTTNADVYDFHDLHSALLIPLFQILRRNSSIVFSLYGSERTKGLGYYIGIKFADQIVTSEKTLQYEIYRKYGRLPTYVPLGATLSKKFLRQGKKNFTRLGLIADQKRTNNITRRYKSKRVKFCAISENEIDSDDSFTTMQNVAALFLLKTNLDTGTLRKIALLGLPIVTFDTEHSRDIFRNNALYIPFASPLAVENAIKELKRNYSQYRAKAKSLQKFTTNLFSWETVAGEYLNVYQKSKLTGVPLDSLSKAEAV